MRDRILVAGLLALSLLPPSFLFSRAADEPQAEQTASDARTLRDFGLSSQRSVLLRFFQLRTVTETDRKQFPKLIEQLGSDSFDEREAAQSALLARGPSVRELLDRHRDHADVEIARRCRELISLLENGPGVDLTCAAVRQLTPVVDPEVVPVLLDYLPFAEDASVVEEVLEGLVRAVKLPGPTPLQNELGSERAERRAAAAFVLGRAAAEEIREKVMPLLADRVPEVRFRAAQGLLFAREPKAVATLIELIPSVPLPLLARIEEILFHLAASDAPRVSSGKGTEADRQACRDGWSEWWKANQGKVDLSRITKPIEFLGINVIPEMHANRVWECGRDGKQLWELAGLHCPIDAQVLPSGRILVAELNGHRVTERDRTGKIYWEHKVNTPIACRRLPGGATWISTNHKFFTVDGMGRETNVYTPENGFFIHSAYRMNNGNVAVVSMNGEIREINPGGQVVRSIPLMGQGSWSGISVTGTGNYLVANNGNGFIQEVAHDGRVVWEYRKPGVCYATRLPGGHTLVINNSSGMVEVDRTGNSVWEQKIATSLWRGHRR